MEDGETHAFVEEELVGRERDRRLRQLRPLVPGPDAARVEREGREYVNFSSNDYLGLSRHPRLRERSAEFTRRYGAGSTASRLLTGTYEIHGELEERLARFFRRPACMLFNTGFQANSTLVSSLTTRHSLVLADRLCHNSLLQGSLRSRAAFRRYSHNDTADLEEQLERSAGEDYDRVLVLTESVFSMDGDRAPLDRIGALTSRYGAMLFVDDAHAAGVLGEGGRGLAPPVDGADLVLGTFGKAFGSFGAYLLCGERMKQYLLNVCPGFIYTTALPPAVVGAVGAALELMPELESERRALEKRAEELRKDLEKAGFDTGASESQIIPLITGSEASAMDLARHLEEGGVLAPAIRPPTVPEASSRLRLSLSSVHREEHLRKLTGLLGKWRDE